MTAAGRGRVAHIPTGLDRTDGFSRHDQVRFPSGT